MKDGLTVMMSRILSRLWTLSPGTTSFTTGSVPSWKRQDRAGHQQEGTASGFQLDQNVQTHGSRHTYTLLDAELQTSILDHVDAVIFVPRPEQAFALLQLDEDHVTAQLQKEGLLEMTQDPAANKTRARDGQVNIWTSSASTKGTLIQPDVLQHVENLRREIGALHIKLGQVGLQ